MKIFPAKTPRNSGQTLVALLITLAIIAVLAVAMMYGTGAFNGNTKSNRPDGLGKTIPTRVKLKAEDVVCRQKLGQVRSSLQILMGADETPPATLTETRLGADFYKCPIGKEPYSYDPASGVVTCPHLGHEKY